MVLAADGYPDAPVGGSVIHGADQDFGPDVVVFHAGTVRDADGTLRAAGGQRAQRLRMRRRPRRGP